MAEGNVSERPHVHEYGRPWSWTAVLAPTCLSGHLQLKLLVFAGN